jgi:hypothetical protein
MNDYIAPVRRQSPSINGSFQWQADQFVSSMLAQSLR